eukprot:gene24578-biopygen4424
MPDSRWTTGPEPRPSFGRTRFVKKLSTLLCSGDDLTRTSSVECGTPGKRCAQSRLGPTSPSTHLPRIMLCNINCPQPLSHTAPPARMLRSPRLGDSVQDSLSCMNEQTPPAAEGTPGGEDGPPLRCQRNPPVRKKSDT